MTTAPLVISTLALLTLVGCDESSSSTNTGTGGAGGSDASTTGTGAPVGATTTVAATVGSGGSTPTSGCGKTGEPVGANDAATIVVGGEGRTYAIFVPATYDPNVPLALVFGWHGLGGTGAGIRGYLGLEEASAGQAILVYPDAHGQPDNGWNLEKDGTDIAIFDALLTDISSRYCIDADRVFSTGFSYGGWMANATGCFRPDKVRAIAPIAGGGPSNGCTEAVAAFITHGADDNAELVSSGRASRDFWANMNQCALTTKPVAPSPCVEYDDCDGGAPVVWCEHTGLGGHVVPEFDHQGIWSFFSRFP